MTKNYVVVGGLSGIGQSIVNILSSDPSSSIIATSRTHAESSVQPSNVSVLQLDLLDPRSIDHFLYLSRKYSLGLMASSFVLVLFRLLQL